MKDDIAAGGECRLGAGAEAAAQRLHRQVVGEQEAVEADVSADDLLHHLARDRRRQFRVDRGIDHMRGHRDRQVAEPPERFEIGALQLGARSLDHGQRLVAIGPRPPMPRNVLDDRQNPARDQAFGGGARELSHDLDLHAVGAIADDAMALGQPQVGDRHAIDGDAECRKLGGDQPRPEPCRRHPARPVAAVGVAKPRRGRKIRPLRRRKALHPPAFLIDQHGGLVVTDDSAKFLNQSRDLSRAFDIPLEKDQAPGLGRGREIPARRR